MINVLKIEFPHKKFEREHLPVVINSLDGWFNQSELVKLISLLTFFVLKLEFRVTRAYGNSRQCTVSRSF